MKNYQVLKNWMENTYGESHEITINYDGKQVTGIMYGNDECFDTNDFYQYFLTSDGKLYKAYFEIPDNTKNLSDLDYENPYSTTEEDVDYWIDFVV